MIAEITFKHLIITINKQLNADNPFSKLEITKAHITGKAKNETIMIIAGMNNRACSV
ncbi:MAG: hypothetical protein HQ521_06355 [Bacteroidetes bacterium]|nr:hypothetical protein [Bacteroidota bacterium]